jgi:pyruvate formate lyase activating enzyme
MPAVFDIVRGSFVDGPGIRTVIFFQGCPLRCPWCHNPESQPLERELSGDVRPYPVDELLEIIMRDISYFQASGGGVTFSGGEPLLHIEYLVSLCEKLKAKNVSVAFDTSGYFSYNEFARELVRYTDIMLFDLKIVDEAASENSIGKSSGIIIDNLKKLVSSGIRIVIRIPLIPGFTLPEENLSGIANLMKEFCLNEFDMISYNPSCIDKLIKMGKAHDSRLPSFPLSMEQEKGFRDRFACMLGVKR